MRSFYVNACVKGLDSDQALSWLREAGQTGFVGPATDGWTCLVSEALDMQDPRAIDSCGTALTRASDRVALITLNHDGDILWVGLFRDGQQVGEFNSAPGYFADDPSEDDMAPLLREPQAFASALGVDKEVIDSLLPPPGSFEPADALHERWARTLGLPEHSVGMGFRYVERGESNVEWTKA